MKNNCSGQGWERMKNKCPVQQLLCPALRQVPARPHSRAPHSSRSRARARQKEHSPPLDEAKGPSAERLPAAATALTEPPESAGAATPEKRTCTSYPRAAADEEAELSKTVDPVSAAVSGPLQALAPIGHRCTQTQDLGDLQRRALGQGRGGGRRNKGKEQQGGESGALRCTRRAGRRLSMSQGLLRLRGSSSSVRPWAAREARAMGPCQEAIAMHRASGHAGAELENNRGIRVGEPLSVKHCPTRRTQPADNRLQAVLCISRVCRLTLQFWSRRGGHRLS